MMHDWRNINLPHDWSIEDLPGTNSPFNPDAVSGWVVDLQQAAQAWYSKEFLIPPSQK